jgi:hypothetical protein
MTVVVTHRCQARACGHPIRRGVSVDHGRLEILDRPVKPGDHGCGLRDQARHRRHCEARLRRSNPGAANRDCPRGPWIASLTLATTTEKATTSNVTLAQAASGRGGLSVDHCRLGILDRPVKPGDDGYGLSDQARHRRHCEARLRRSNPGAANRDCLRSPWIASLTLAMTRGTATASAVMPAQMTAEKVSPARRGGPGRAFTSGRLRGRWRPNAAR